MNFTLLLPTALAALAALLLPLLVHLARRSERRPTDFAALRWLHAQARPRRNVRFDEWLLLALRLLLVALLALLLGRPVLFGAPDATPWVVAAQGVAGEELQTFEAPEGVQRRWLAPGFPNGAQASPPARVPIGSLLRELDATLPADAPLTVLAPAVLAGADAERPVLSRPVDWRVVSTTSPASPTAVDAARAAAMPTLVVRHAPDRAPALRYLRAATAAWRSGTTDTTSDPARTAINVGDIAQTLPTDAALLVWLAPGPLPSTVRAWIEAGGTALLDAQATLPGIDRGSARWRDADGDVLVRGVALGRGQALQWTRAMTPRDMPELLEGDFPQHLRALLSPPPPAPARVAAAAYAPTIGAAPWPETPRELAPWLIVLIAALFAIERWFASSARRKVPG